MSQQMHCPVCGSTDTVENQYNDVISESYGGSKKISLFKNLCKSCETSTDSENRNDEIIQTAVDELKAKAVVNILNDFVDNGYNLSSMERALELPQRTLAKWKSTGKPSAAGVTLLKFLRCFPWLLEVAEQNFDFQSAQKVFVTSAFKVIANNSSYIDPFHSIEPKTSVRPFIFNYTQESRTNITLMVNDNIPAKHAGTLSKHSVFTIER